MSDFLDFNGPGFWVGAGVIAASVLYTFYRWHISNRNQKKHTITRTDVKHVNLFEKKMVSGDTRLLHFELPSEIQKFEMPEHLVGQYLHVSMGMENDSLFVRPYDPSFTPDGHGWWCDEREVLLYQMPRSKNDSKPRGRMTAYAFFVQTCREEHKKKHPDESVVFSEFSRKCAERWKTMSEKEKKRFQEMADRDKKRYEAEMQDYVPPKGEKGRGKKRRHTKDPNAPKRSLSAFFWFCNDERPKVKGMNPEYGVGEIAKELGRLWAEAEPDTKRKYEAMAERDKARYEREMTAYKKRGKVEAVAPENDDDEDEDDDDDDGDDD